LGGKACPPKIEMKIKILTITTLILWVSIIFIGCGEEYLKEEDEPLEVVWTKHYDSYSGAGLDIGGAEYNGIVIIIQFNHPLDTETTASTISISPDLGESKSVLLGDLLLASFKSKPELNHDYTVTVDMAVRDIYGNSLSEPYEFSFTYRGCDGECNTKEKFEPLKVVWTVPPDGYAGTGSMEFGSDSDADLITIRFNHPMDGKTIMSALSISPELGEIDDWMLLGDMLMLEWQRAPELNREYKMTLDTTAKDIYGNSLKQPYTFSFMYRFGIIRTYPRNGERGVMLDNPISIRFNGEIDLAACKEAFSITPAVDGEFEQFEWEFEDKPRSLIFSTISLKPNTQYKVTIGKEAKSAKGDSLSVPYTFSFTTGEGPPPGPPANLRETIPPDGGEIAANGVITFKFDNLPVQGTVKVNGTPAEVRGTICAWKPPVPLKEGVQTFEITWGNGDGSTGSHIITLHVESIDVTPPTIVSSSPKDGAKDVDPKRLMEDGIVITFDDKMNLGRTKDIYIAIGEDRLFWRIMEWSDDRKTVTLEYRKGLDLPYESEIKIVIKGATDDAGNVTDLEIIFLTMAKE